MWAALPGVKGVGGSKVMSSNSFLLLIDETTGYTDSKMGSCSSWINSGEFWWPFKVGWYAQKLAKNRQKRVKKADFGRFSKISKCNYTLPVSSISLQLGTNIGLRNANNFIWADFWFFSKKWYLLTQLGPKMAFSWFLGPNGPESGHFWQKIKNRPR